MTDNSFITYNPRLCCNGFSKMGPRRVYRTGDLMRRDERGLHYYIGRKDNQVKISGKRVELETIESMLQETDLVSAATFIKITPQELGRSAFLVAFCVPRAANVTAAAILDDYAGRNARLVVPRFKLVESLPLKTNGKVDRDQLQRQYTRERESSQARGRQGSSLAAELRYLWLDVLGIPDKDLQPMDDFIGMGGNSLMVASLIARINHSFGISLRASTLYDRMALKDLTQLLTTLHRDSQAELPIHVNEEAEWLRDSHLGQHLQPSREALVVTDWTAASEGRVFLTGATGFVGAFFLAALLQKPFVKQVCCLVRAHAHAHGRVRLQKTLLKYHLYLPNLDRLTVLHGSFGEARLGLDTQQYDYYAEWASVVFHLGAKVNYLATYSAHRNDNVLGTVRMLEFATHKRTKPVHYTSTIAAYGPTGHILGTKFLPEDERPPRHIASLHYDTGYAQSQFVAEIIAWRAIDKGLPVAIYRPGFVLGHSRSGICNRDDFISPLFASCLEVGAYPVLPLQRKEFVPVDFVVDARLHISSCERGSLGHAFNLIHPDPASVIDVCAAFALLNRISPSPSSPPSPGPVRGVPYTEWVQSLSLRPGDPLYPLLPMLREKVLGDRTRWEVYEDMAEYGRGNLRRALRAAPGILDCSPMDRLIEWCLGSWLGVLNDK
jgi:thioester reductase-like protein